MSKSAPNKSVTYIEDELEEEEYLINEDQACAMLVTAIVKRAASDVLKKNKHAAEAEQWLKSNRHEQICDCSVLLSLIGVKLSGEDIFNKLEFVTKTKSYGLKPHRKFKVVTA